MGKRKQKKEVTMEPTKEVATKQTNAVSTPMASNGFFSQITAKDVTMAKILPLHYMSEKVKDKNIEAKAGEFRDTVSNELFGDTDTPFEFIPLGLQKWWVKTKLKGNEFVEKYAVTPANENQPLEDAEFKYVYTMEYFVMLPSKLKELGTHIPYVLSFRLTSLKAGKNLASKIWELQLGGKNPWDMVFELSVKESSNDKGDFFVQSATPKRKPTEEEKAACAKWYTMITSGQVNAKVDDRDLNKMDDIADVNTDKF